MNAVIPYHRGVLTQRGKGIGGVFSSLFRYLLPIGQAFVRSSPKIIKNTVKSPLGKKLRRSAKKVAINTAKNLLESGDINKTLKKTIEDSKKEVSSALKSSRETRKRKNNNQPRCRPKKYHFLK